MVSLTWYFKPSSVFMLLLSRSALTLILLTLALSDVRAQSPRAANISQGEPTIVPSVNSNRVSDSNTAAVTDPTTILRNAKLIYVRKKSVYFKASELENELRKRPEFARWGLLVTRNDADADLIIEVGRKLFTTKFIYTVIDPRTDIVVLSGKIDSIGGTVAQKIAKQFTKQMLQVRQ